MMRIFRSSLHLLVIQIALLGVTVFAHHDHPTTISPSPTESPAPSPSPSEVPTDTQQPTISLMPSISPTWAPTTSMPSNHPSDSPTESPAPSPSPSEAPTDVPSASPSRSQSPSDTPSSRPSWQPSISPSFQPSISVAPSLSHNPTNGPIFVISSGNEIFFEGFDSRMDDEAEQDFEKTILLYLQETITSLPGASSVVFESVRVTDQSIATADAARRLNVAGLLVIFDVAALALVQDESLFKYDNDITTLLRVDGVVQFLKSGLASVSEFFDTNKETSAPSTANNPTQTSSVDLNAKKPGSRNFAVAAVLSLLLTGYAGAFYRRRHKHKQADESDIREEHTPSVSDSDPFDVESKSKNRDEAIILDIEADSRFDMDRLECVETDLIQAMPSWNQQLALIPITSNIEIPDTPVTNFEPSPMLFKTEDGGMEDSLCISEDDSIENDQDSALSVSATDALSTGVIHPLQNITSDMSMEWPQAKNIFPTYLSRASRPRKQSRTSDSREVLSEIPNLGPMR